MPNIFQSVETTIGCQYSYDSEGRIVAIQDSQGRKTSINYEYHANGRIRRMNCRFPGGNGITHEFDEWGRRIKPEGKMSEWVWGPENALWQATHNILNATYAKQ